jgi:hypothetical protein
MYVFSPVPVSEVYPNSANDFGELKTVLRSLNLHSTLALCSRLNVRLATIEQQLNQDDLIRSFFDKDQQRCIYQYFESIETGQRGAVFHRGQLLELIRWVCLYCENQETNTFEAFDEKQKFAHAALIANELWSNRVYRPWLTNGNIHITRENSLGPLRQATGEASPQVDMLRAFGRGKVLFGDLFSHHYPNFENEFSGVTNLSIRDYYTLLFAIRALLEQTIETGQHFPINTATLKSAMPHLTDAVEAFIRSESQTPEELKYSLWNGIRDINAPEEAPIFDLKPLRIKPILRLSSDQIVVLDIAFFTDKASVGPLFHLLQQNLRRNQGRDIFSAFGYAFEEYACEILKRMYPDSPSGLVDRFMCNYPGIASGGNRVQITDAILDDVNQTALFEMKAKWIRDDRLLSENPDEYIRYIISQYSNEQPRLQLATSITKLESGEWVPENGRVPSTRIYPILLCYDSLLNALGYSWMFAEAFKAGLQPDHAPEVGDMEKGRYRVTPMILMTIDVLEDLEASVKNFNLCTLLSDYSAKCANRMDSLHSFIRGSEYQKLMDRRGTIMLESIELMTEAMRSIDPNWDPDEDDWLGDEQVE